MTEKDKKNPADTARDSWVDNHSWMPHDNCRQLEMFCWACGGPLSPPSRQCRPGYCKACEAQIGKDLAELDSQADGHK